MPHTKQQLRELLHQAGISPRHKWGQNFLIDLNLMRLLVGEANLQGNEIILEVGCGTGSLTGMLAKKAGAVVSVEIDANLADIAKAQLTRHDNITLLRTDVLSGKNTITPTVSQAITETQEKINGPLYLIANLPYQVASPLMVNLLLNENIPAGFFVTIQAEVADRMTASPGSKSYGLLSILTQATGLVKKIRTIKPQAFWPLPKVNSAIISWQYDHLKYRQIEDIKFLKKTIDLLLRHRRKKIHTCLNQVNKVVYFSPLLETLSIDPHARAETLPVEKFVQLANLWAKQG